MRHAPDFKARETIQPTTLPERPWEKVAVDLFEIEGDHYVLVVDYYSRFPELRKLSSTSLIKVGENHLGIDGDLACHGVPCELVMQ